jgi:ribosomal protein S18 acetylase RimI-like enzyme
VSNDLYPIAFSAFQPIQQTMKSPQVIRADLDNPLHQQAIVSMMDAYSRDPMGDDRPLSEYARQNLFRGLREHPTALVYLVLDESVPCGIATCFRGFSTFAAKPLINVSDFYIVPAWRGHGLGGALLSTIESEAKRSGCCKLTLEVQSNNQAARAIYEHYGFRQAVYAADAQANAGGSLYMVKPLE